MRLRLPQIFSNGLRYRTADGTQPEFLAAYDVMDIASRDRDFLNIARKPLSERSRNYWPGRCKAVFLQLGPC